MPNKDARYEQDKERARRFAAAKSLSGRDIGRLPPIARPDRRRRAAGDFQYFCEAYFPGAFTLKFSSDHLKVIARIETAVLNGGLFAMAMPRGSGKTTLVETAALWAVLIGAHLYVALIGSSEAHAVTMLDSIKTELETNPRLAEDFPEVCYPIHRLEGISQRAHGQLYHGRSTHIGWTQKEIVLPTIPGSHSSGAIIQVAGITGRIRGMKHKLPDGRSVRPSLVILDDPQTDQSARSPGQCATRESILAGAVLGLAGPGQKISGIMPCTVIRPDDMADNILDRDKHPEWQGERTKLIYSFPSATALWDDYATIRADHLRAGGDGSAATEFYRTRRQEMDEGAKVAWPERHNPDELSAVQHAMNLFIADAAAFAAEYQNEPIDERTDPEALTADAIAKRTNGRKRGVVPIEATHLVSYLDVHERAHYYAVLAVSDNFTGSVIDYGTYPDQKTAYFSLRQVKRTLRRAAPRAGVEGAIYAGLQALTAGTPDAPGLLAREWRREDGTMMRIERCMVDANWGQMTNVVYEFCRRSPHAAVLLPSHGRSVRAAHKPMGEYKRTPGDRLGLNWRIPHAKARRSIRYVLYDTNFWKSFGHARLAVPTGDPGSIDLFGQRGGRHRMFSEHLVAEYYTRTEGRGRVVDEWFQRPDRDNHGLDCFTGCLVAAAMQGCTLPGSDPPPAARARRKRRVKF